MTHRQEPWPAGTPCWAELTASDPDRTRTFYRAVLGWQFGEPDPGFDDRCDALVDGAPVAGIARSGPGPDGVPRVWRVFLASRDVAASTRRVVAAGGRRLAEPLEVGRLGTAGRCADPTGAEFGLWQADEHVGFPVADAPGAVVWCDLMTPDHGTARDFYAQVFGYDYEDVATEGVSYAMFTVPDGERPAGGIGGTDASAENAPAVWSVCFRVEDVDDVVQRVRDAGGSVMEDPIEFPYGRLAVVAGPDRESFAIMTPTEPE